MLSDSEQLAEPEEWGLNEEIEFYYNANMVANETLANLESMDAMTKQQKSLKESIMQRCMFMLDKSTEYFYELIEQFDVIHSEKG
jgi:hypothetical protein